MRQEPNNSVYLASNYIVCRMYHSLSRDECSHKLYSIRTARNRFNESTHILMSSTIPRLDPMYNWSITFLVDKFPYPISHLVSICVISCPFIPTNHSNPFSFYLQLYHEMFSLSTTGTSVPGPSS